jgi:hypothetical protein
MKSKKIPNTLFIEELPLVELEEELQSIKERYLQYDSYFIASGCIERGREKFDALWQNYKPYADTQFLKAIKHNFHQRSWEMYLCNVFLNKQLKIQSKNEGPDLIVNDNIYIECVAPTKGDVKSKDSVPEIQSFGEMPTDEIILRITQSLKYKALEQYDKWKSKQWFNPKSPFIIAINISDLGYPDTINLNSINPSIIVKILFSIGTPQINFNKSTNESKVTYSNIEKIFKSNQETVNLGLFTDKFQEEYKVISGVIFSNTDVLNHPENLGDDCIFVNNPLAENSVPEWFMNLFKYLVNKGQEVYLKENF